VIAAKTAALEELVGDTNILAKFVHQVSLTHISIIIVVSTVLSLHIVLLDQRHAHCVLKASIHLQ
jgi:hypothetical protein